MSREPTPLAPAGRRGLGGRILDWAVSIVVRASLLVSPRPAALLVRKIFASAGAKTAEALERHAPTGIAALRNERYGEDRDMLLDVFRPQDAVGALPLVLWVHGGGFVGGAKEELAGYFKLVASNGYSVVAPRYSLAPEHRYPTPVRQMMLALEFVQSNAQRLRVDASRIAIAGDSAGAHIAAQLAALATTPGYPDAVGVPTTITAEQLRGLVLTCGPYDLGLARQPGSPAGHRFQEIVLWAYSGTRHYLADPAFTTWGITDHLTPAFPPTLLSVGNADPLRPHSELLAERLRAEGVETETLFFPDDYEPALGHEYQFDLDSDAGQLFLERLLAFLSRKLTAPVHS